MLSVYVRLLVPHNMTVWSVKLSNRPVTSPAAPSSPCVLAYFFAPSCKLFNMWCYCGRSGVPVHVSSNVFQICNQWSVIALGRSSVNLWLKSTVFLNKTRNVAPWTRHDVDWWMIFTAAWPSHNNWHIRHYVWIILMKKQILSSTNVIYITTKAYLMGEKDYWTLNYVLYCQNLFLYLEASQSLYFNLNIPPAKRILKEGPIMI